MIYNSSETVWKSRTHAMHTHICMYVRKRYCERCSSIVNSILSLGTSESIWNVFVALKIKRRCISMSILLLSSYIFYNIYTDNNNSHHAMLFIFYCYCCFSCCCWLLLCNFHFWRAVWASVMIKLHFNALEYKEKR